MNRSGQCHRHDDIHHCGEVRKSNFWLRVAQPGAASPDAVGKKVWFTNTELERRNWRLTPFAIVIAVAFGAILRRGEQTAGIAKPVAPCGVFRIVLVRQLTTSSWASRNYIQLRSTCEPPVYAVLLSRTGPATFGSVGWFSRS